MTEAQFLDAIEPGQWAVDNSAHRYFYQRKWIVGFRWDALSSDGKRYRGGYTKTREEAERLARAAAA